MLGFRRALHRELRVWAIGLGLGIPLVSQICQLIAWSDLGRKRRMAWDEELGAVVHYRDTDLWGVLRLGAAVLLVLTVAATLGFSSAHQAGTP